MSTEQDDIRWLRERLEAEMHPRWKEVYADLLGPLANRLAARRNSAKSREEELIGLLGAEIRELLERLDALKRGLDTFNDRHASLDREAERRANMLAYAETLGANAIQVRGDRRAFRRYFDHDALVARYNRRDGALQRELAFVLERLGYLAESFFRSSTDAASDWHHHHLEALLLPLLEFAGDPRVATAAFQGLAGAVRGLPEAMHEAVLGAEAVRTIYRLAQDREREVWIQCEALDLLRQIAPASFAELARIRLAEYAAEDDLFIRARLVPAVLKIPDLQDLRSTMVSDPKPFVRQALARSLATLPPAEALHSFKHLAENDEIEAVRATALLTIPELVHAGMGGALAERLGAILRAETDTYVLRVAILVAEKTHREMPELERPAWRDQVLPVLAELHAQHGNLAVRRWAALARERIWCFADPDRVAVYEGVQAVTRNIRPGKGTWWRDERAAACDDVTLGRILGVAVQEDFGLDVVRRGPRMKLIRGHRFGRRLWRWWYELKKPSPDKRQAFRHTIGRVFEGDLRIPSPMLSEMSQTKVPGEPYTLSSEAGWRPYLPLVDEVLSALDEQSARSPLRIVTSEGVTTVTPPRSVIARLKALHAIHFGFPEFARLRNSETPADYVQALREAGIELSFEAHAESADPSVETCYAHAALGLPLAVWTDTPGFSRLREYFYSVYANSLGELTLFLVGTLSLFLGRHIYLNQVFFRLRKQVPLVVGGWGTRGKSGTERIKAALFNATGHRMVSKTTGCEAMFLYADAFGPTHELFLFRPYDKATIWEQVNIVNLCSRLGGHVFLWECMGLTPSYIEIIQRHWMKDDISTIVNTYPDHEDLQGPAGVNIPEVMTFFVRKHGHVLTSEQQMTPILEAEAQRLDSRLDQVGWLEPGLLTPDILERFPYEEHPNNIALVAELGVQLGIPYDFSVKEMADRVVADLGVLKVYPVAELDGRRLQFVNGCSANERFGALGNWTRLKFDQQNPREEPGVWITVVVNNRADRIARSRVFASIVVEDIAVDKIFLIGSNLDGMRAYIREAFDTHAQTLSLSGHEGKGALEVFRELTHRFRLPTSETELHQAVDAIQGEGDLARWRGPYETALAEYQAFAARIEQGSGADDDALRKLLWSWFVRKLVVVEDYFSTGDQTMHRISEETPPGYLNRIMGLQNIKGTGLDFVYRWQAWDLCYQACQKIIDRKPKIARDGLAALAAFKDYGLLCETEVRRAVEQAGPLHGQRDKGFQTQLTLCLETMEGVLTHLRGSLGSAGNSGGLRSRMYEGLIRFAEAVLDAGDAVRRRKRADTIYRDMANERVSPARAAQEVQLLNKRQKGGWLKKDLEAWRKRGRKEN